MPSLSFRCWPRWIASFSGAEQFRVVIIAVAGGAGLVSVVLIANFLRLQELSATVFSWRVLCCRSSLILLEEVNLTASLPDRLYFYLVQFVRGHWIILTASWGSKSSQGKSTLLAFPSFSIGFNIESLYDCVVQWICCTVIALSLRQLLSSEMIRDGPSMFMFMFIADYGQTNPRIMDRSYLSSGKKSVGSIESLQNPNLESPAHSCFNTIHTSIVEDRWISSVSWKSSDIIVSQRIGSTRLLMSRREELTFFGCPNCTATFVRTEENTESRAAWCHLRNYSTKVAWTSVFFCHRLSS